MMNLGPNCWKPYPQYPIWYKIAPYLFLNSFDREVLLMKPSLNDSNAWLGYRRTNPQATLRLFCFPYAGGGSSIFNTWSNYLPTRVEVCPIHLPGRENRIRETPYTRLVPLVDALVDALFPLLEEKPFAFFGHSLGARVSFELARCLRRQGGALPVHMFVSGARAPHIPNPEAPIHQLNKHAFLDALKNLSGTPLQVLEHEDLMELLLPCLRADFELYETYEYQAEEPLPVPLTIFGGWQDKEVTPDQIEMWREHTLDKSTIHMFLGDHFFLHSSREQLLRIVAQELLSHAGKGF
jgi:medium-chain acyl-[acyl-carrier-protein] hydrolase